jgi:hypothetical protein
MAKKSTTETTTKSPVVSNKREHKLNFKPVDEVEYEVIKYDNPEIVERMQKEYPEMSGEYLRIMFTQYEIFCKKNLDYGPSNIALGTSLSTDEEKKTSLSGVWFRMMDKISRLKQLVVLGKDNNVGEATEDTYQDLANYSIISQIIQSGKWGK